MTEQAVIHLTLGNEAMAKIDSTFTGDDNDLLLAIEKLIQQKAGLEGGGDPHTDPEGVYVEDFEIK